MSNEYKCAMCGGEFEKVTPDAEAIAEMESFFGAVPESERVIVCDDCFNMIHPADNPEKVASARDELRRARETEEGR